MAIWMNSVMPQRCTHTRDSLVAEGQLFQKENWSSRKNGGKLEEKYEVSGVELGRGHFGVVKTCFSKETGQAFACKTVLKEKLEVQYGSGRHLAVCDSRMRFWLDCWHVLPVFCM